MSDSLGTVSKTNHNLYCIVCLQSVTQGLFFLDFDELLKRHSMLKWEDNDVWCFNALKIQPSMNYSLCRLTLDS